MQATVRRRGANLVFRLDDVPEAHRKQLEGECFLPEDGGHVRIFPGDIPHAEVIARNFERHAVAMFEQGWSAEPLPWEEALLHFHDRLQARGLDWFLVGSCVLTVHGLDVRPSDVDVVFPRLADLEAVRTLLADVTVLPMVECPGWVARAYGALFLGATVAVAFETQPCLDVPDPIDAGPWAERHLVAVEWKGRLLRVPPLELCLNVNRRRGRLDRVRLLERHLGSPA